MKPARAARLTGVLLARIGHAAGSTLTLLALTVPVPAAAAPNPTGTLRISGAGDLTGLDPHSRNEAFTNRILRQINEPLIRRDERLQLRPGLALSWRNVEAQVWRVQLRSGVRFAQGEPFDAQDVVFSIRRAQHAHSALRHYALPLGQVRALGPLEVEFRTPEANPVFAEQLALIPIMSAAWSRTQGCEQPASARQKKETACTTRSNGTGAMRISEWKAGQVLRLERHDAWWGDWSQVSGNVSRIHYRPSPSASSRLAGLLGGDVDLVFDASPTEVVQLARHSGFQVFKAVEARTVFLGFDQASERLRASPELPDNPLRKREVRQALAQGIDHAALLAKIHRGYAQSSFSMVMPDATGHLPAHEMHPVHDPEAARALLANAGYPRGFALRLGCPSDRHPTDLPLCTAITAMWTRLGLKVELVTAPKSTYFERLDKPRENFDVFLMSWGGATTDAAFTLGPLAQTRNAQGDGSDNYGGISNPLIDQALVQARHEMAPVRRAQLLSQALSEHNRQIHDLALHRQMLIWAARQGLELPIRGDGVLEFQSLRIPR